MPAGCSTPTVALPVVRVSWSAETLGVAFASYEVQRRDERDPEWRTIASIPTSATTELFDHEARMGGVASTYRVRQVRTDGVGSEWTLTAALPVPTPEACAAAMVFTTNTDGSRAVAAPDLAEGSKPSPRDYEPMAAGDVSTHPIYGRDGLVAFRSLERRGVTFSRSLVVDAMMGTRPKGLVVFDPLRDLCEDPTLPYVCVRDSFGDRFLAMVSPKDLGIVKADRHRAAVDVVELTARPNPITAWNGTLGHPWETMGPGRWGTSAGVAKLREHTGGTSLAVQDTGLVDGAVKARLTTPAAGNGVAFRVVDSQNYLAVESNPSFGTWVLAKVVGGTLTNVASGLGGSAGNTLEARFSGSSSTGGLVVTMFDGGNRRGSWTITEPVFDGATRHGISYRGATAAPTTGWDEWEAWDPTQGIGSPWTTHTGTWRAEDSQLLPFATDLAGTGRNIITTDAGSPDVQVHARGLDAQDFTGLILRYVDSENYMVARASRTFSAWALIQRIASVETVLASAVGSATDDLDVVAQVRGDRFRLRVNGAWLDWGGGATTFLLPGSVAPLAASTRHGLGHLTAFNAGLSGVALDGLGVDPVANMGQSGAQLTTGPSTIGQGKWVDAMRAMPIIDGDDLAVGVWGINDAILSPSAHMLSGWRHALRSVASWWLRRDEYQETDPTVAYSPVASGPPIGLWMMDNYVAVGDGTGRYPNMGTAGATLDLLEPGTAGSAPTRSQVGGQWVATFDAVNDRLTISAANAGALDWIPGRSRTVVLFVTAMTSTGTSFVMGKRSGTGTVAGWYLRFGGGVLSTRVSDAVTDPTSGTVAKSQPAALVARLLPAGHNVTMGTATTLGTYPAGSAVSTSGFSIGASPTGTAPTNMVIRGAAVFDRDVSQAEVNAWAAAVFAGTITGNGWTPVAATDRNTGTGVTVGGHGASATISVPAGYVGGPIALRFVGGGAAGGGTPTGTASVYVDGAAVPTVWPTNIWTGAGAYLTMTTLRLPGLAPGAHTIRVVVDATVGALVFDGWHVEQDDPLQAARVRLANVPRIIQSPQFHDADLWSANTIGDTQAEWVPDSHVGETVRIYAGTGAGQVRNIVNNTADTITIDTPWVTMPDRTSDFIVPQPGSPWGNITDDDVAAFNADQATVAAEFAGGLVQVVDLDAALHVSHNLFSGDELHPNAAGARAFAAAVQDTLGTWRPARLWMAGHSYSVGTGAAVARGIDDALRRLLTVPLALDGFARTLVRRFRDNFTR